MNPEPRDPSFFVELVLGYRSAKIVFVAHGLGLFALLDGGPRTADEVAAALGADARATLLLLRALAALGLLAFDGERFANGALASSSLVPGKPGYVGSNLAYQELLWPGWSALGEIVKSGHPPAGLVELLNRGEFTGDYLRSVNALSRGPADEVMRRLGGRPMRRLLDVGGGLGAYALRFVEEDAGRTATLLDLEPTLALTRGELAAHPAGARVELRSGDYITSDFGTGFDLVLLSHVTHDESEDVNVGLLEKARAALAPGGRVAIHDFVTDEGGCGPRFAALFSVNMLVYTRGGRVYSIGEYRAMLTQAGFCKVEVFAISAGRPAATALVVGEVASAATR